MNREIKFRAFDTHSPKVYTGHSISISSDGTFMFLDADGQWKEDVDGRFIIMQHTGLKDKNGKEIWEGDIIKTERGDWGLIVWKAPFFEVTVSEDQSCMYSREWFDTVEVVGNIYDNPELLNSQ